MAGVAVAQTVAPSAAFQPLETEPIVALAEVKVMLRVGLLRRMLSMAAGWDVLTPLDDPQRLNHMKTIL